MQDLVGIVRNEAEMLSAHFRVEGLRSQATRKPRSGR